MKSMQNLIICLVWLMLAPADLAESGAAKFSIESKLNCQPTTATPAASHPYRILHPESRDAICMETLRGKSIPVYFHRFKGGYTSEQILAAFAKSPLGTPLKDFFNLRESAEKTQPITGLSFQWLKAPRYDWFEQRLDFAILLFKNGAEHHVFAKTIFLMPQGFEFYELDQAYGPRAEALALKLSTQLRRSPGSVRVQHNAALNKAGQRPMGGSTVLREILFPAGSGKASEAFEAASQGFIERHRHWIGSFFLVTAMLFFILMPRPHRY